MNRIVHFEIPIDDPDRATAFYRDAFGWQIQLWEGPQPYWLVTTGEDTEPGINGALMRRQGDFQGVTNTLGVDSIDEAIGKVEAAGGTVAMPKMAIEEMGWVAYVRDTEGNLVGLFENNPASGQG